MEGIRGSNPQSDVAWDDVTIVHGKCGTVSVMPEPEEPIPTSGDLSVTTSSKVCTKPILLHKKFLYFYFFYLYLYLNINHNHLF